LVVVGLLSIQSNDFIEAEKYFKQALNSDIKNKDAIYLYLGQIAEKNGNDTEAIEWYGSVQQPQQPYHRNKQTHLLMQN
jgi:tetratricopeptide (TPR) repeat protein